MSKHLKGNETFNGISKSSDVPSEYKGGPWNILWINVVFFVYIHCAAIYGLYAFFEHPVFHTIYGLITGIGTTAGVHRYFTHRSYKANRILHLILATMHTTAAESSVFTWTRDHRVHHKFTDTNADPHNSNRGFFFCHMGWLMCKKHPEVKAFGSKIDMSDLESDKLLMLQHKYFIPLAILMGFILPTSVAYFIFGQSLTAAWNANMVRYVILLHMVFFTNSWAHLSGNKPYDISISARDCYTVELFGFGESWHNYHHTFPWDYKAGELPIYRFNLTMLFIDFFAWIGWATDLKTVSPEMIAKRASRTGDGSHQNNGHVKVNKDHNGSDLKMDEKVLWGWDDKDMTEGDKSFAKILYQKAA